MSYWIFGRVAASMPRRRRGWWAVQGSNLRPLPCQGSDPTENATTSIAVRRAFRFLSTFVHGFHGHFMGQRAARERSHSVTQMVLGMMAIGAADDVLGST